MGILKRAKRLGRKYLNPVPTRIVDLSLMMKLLPLYLKNKEETEPKVALPLFKTDPEAYEASSSTGLRVTWFGHSSNLVEMDGTSVLIDPVWDERAAPLTWIGPKRFFPPTIALKRLPHIDLVLISHDHYDHLGKQTIQKLVKLRPEVRWVCSMGVGDELVGFGVARSKITELDWTEETVVQVSEAGSVLKITAVPARHFSGRSISSRFETLWSAFVLAGPSHKVYYGADSGLWEGFREIGQQYGPFDLSMLEIGAFHPLWADIHLGPDGALEAFERLGATGLLMPIHWGLFNLAMHAWDQPIERVTMLADDRGVRLFSPAPGVPTEVREMRSEWWRRSER